VVVVYNGARYLAEAIESILAQSYTPVEIIIVDDGSIDGTRDVIEGFTPRVQALWLTHHGLGSARNSGVDASHGDFIAFLDADDVWLPGKLQDQMQRFHRHPHLDMVLTGIQNFWTEDAAVEPSRERGRRYAAPLPGYSCCTLLARREVFRRVGGFADLHLVTDVDWFLRARELGVREELIPEVLVRRRIHRTNASLVYRQEIPDALLGLVKRTLERRRSFDGGRGARTQRSS
jgi:glycosyltransferase involved in cell wall biosynthesis